MKKFILTLILSIGVLGSCNSQQISIKKPAVFFINFEDRSKLTLKSDTLYFAEKINVYIETYDQDMKLAYYNLLHEATFYVLTDLKNSVFSIKSISDKSIYVRKYPLNN